MQNPLESILRELAPFDFADVPLYAMLASEVPFGFMPETSLGVTGKFLDLALCAHLESAGLWQGRGPALIVDNCAAMDLAHGLADAAGTSAVELRDTICIATGLHEAAHYLGDPFDLAENEDTAPQIESLWTAAAALPPEACPSTLLPPWFQHRAPFIRALCHLLYRAEAAGHPIAPHGAEFAFDHECYELSPLADYRAALGDELDCMAAESFETIRGIDPPVAFLELWRNDIREWYIAAERDSLATQIVSAELQASPVPQSTVALTSREPIAFGDDIDCQGRLILGAHPNIAPSGPARFRAVAYSGGTLPSLEGNYGPTVVDLEGLRQQRNCLLTLDGTRVGHASEFANDGRSLTIAGTVWDGARRDELVVSARDGFPWGTRIQVHVDRAENLQAGESATVNGRTVTGPALIVRQSRLVSIAFDDGADDGEVDFSNLEEIT